MPPCCTATPLRPIGAARAWADRLMQAAEQLARESGAHAVRVDTHRHNGAQKKLLERHGYRFCGNILCDEPGHDPRRQAFEKLLR